MEIHVFGLGAIGSNLIIQLMKQYPNFKYFGYDFDIIEDRNIGPQAFFKEQVKAPKTYAIPVIAQRYLRKIDYTPKNIKLEKPPTDLINKEGVLVLDCFDNSKSRKLLAHKASNILHVGFSPFYTAEIMWDSSYEVPGDVDPSRADVCELIDATPFIHFIVNLSALVISKNINESIQENYLITNKYHLKKI